MTIGNGPFEIVKVNPQHGSDGSIYETCIWGCDTLEEAESDLEKISQENNYEKHYEICIIKRYFPTDFTN